MHRRAGIAVLGLCTGAVASAALVVYLGRRSEADQLIEVLAGDNRADAEWAVARLKTLPPEALGERGQRDGRWTPLDRIDVVVAGDLKSSLRSRLAVCHVMEVIRRQVLDGSSGLEGREDQRSWLQQILVRPPSRDPSLARLAAGPDVDGLVEALDSQEIGVPEWALATLCGLSDEALDGVVRHLGREQRTALVWLPTSRKSFHEAEGWPLNAVVSSILAERCGNDVLQLGKRLYRFRGPIFSTAIYVADHSELDWSRWRKTRGAH